MGLWEMWIRGGSPLWERNDDKQRLWTRASHSLSSASVGSAVPKLGQQAVDGIPRALVLRDAFGGAPPGVEHGGVITPAELATEGR